MKRPGIWDLFGLTAGLVFFGAVLTSYLQQDTEQLSVTEAVLDGSEAVQTGHEWIGLYLGDARVGYAHLEKAARDGGGFTYAVETRMTTRSFGSEIRLELDIDAELDSALTLEGFNFVIKAGPAKFSGEGVVQGKRLSFSVNTGGQTLKRTLDLKAPPALKSVMGPQISRLDLTPGRTYQFPVFDPITQSEQTVGIEVIGPDTVAVVDTIVPVTHIRQTISGMVLNAWINSRGEMLRQERAGCRPRPKRRQHHSRGTPVDLVGMTMIPVKVPQTSRPQWSTGAMSVASLSMISQSLITARPLRANALRFAKNPGCRSPTRPDWPKSVSQTRVADPVRPPGHSSRSSYRIGRCHQHGGRRQKPDELDS